MRCETARAKLGQLRPRCGQAGRCAARLQQPSMSSQELAVSKAADALRDCKSRAGAVASSLRARRPMRCEAAVAKPRQPRPRCGQAGRCAARLQQPSMSSQELAVSKAADALRDCKSQAGAAEGSMRAACSSSAGQSRARCKQAADALRGCNSQAQAAEASLWAGWPMRCEAAGAEHEQPRARSEQGGRCAARLQKPSWAVESSLRAGRPMRCGAAVAKPRQPRPRCGQAGRCAARLQQPKARCELAGGCAARRPRADGERTG